MEYDDIWLGTGGTQEFLAIECHSHEMKELGYPDHLCGVYRKAIYRSGCAISY